VLVALAGLVLAFIANALSPRGLALSRNYFPGQTNGAVAAPLIAPSPPAADGTNPASAAQLLAARLEEKGLHIADSNRVARLVHDPRYQQELVVFVDARDDEHYQAGHVPGAFQLDPFRPEQYLPAVLPACQSAEEIVVYCNGGDCEDSEFAAITLRDAGIAPQKLWVYPGGFAEWTTNNLPVEIGARNSGDLRKSTP
jgi:rhodanese-related sulfurtransferase